MNNPNLEVKVGSLVLKNPVLTASGCYGYGTEYEDLCEPGQLGGICTKGLSLKPKKGNPAPRIAETPAGMLNSIGLENIGIEAFISEKIPLLEKINTAIIVNLFGSSPDEYSKLCEIADGCNRIDAVELNISCPNVSAGGVEFGLNPDAAYRVTSEARQKTGKTLLVKLSPNAGDSIVNVAAAVCNAGADAITVMNTISGMDIDLRTKKPRLARVYGGLSGPAIRPVALRMVHLISSKVDIPIVGAGGISNWEDAAAFIIAGASAVQVGTACFSNPKAPEEIIRGLSDWVIEEKAGSVSSLRNSLILSECTGER